MQASEDISAFQIKAVMLFYWAQVAKGLLTNHFDPLNT